MAAQGESQTIVATSNTRWREWRSATGTGRHVALLKLIVMLEMLTGSDIALCYFDTDGSMSIFLGAIHTLYPIPSYAEHVYTCIRY